MTLRSLQRTDLAQSHGSRGIFPESRIIIHRYEGTEDLARGCVIGELIRGFEGWSNLASEASTCIRNEHGTVVGLL
jgi:hypothetical protein